MRQALGATLLVYSPKIKGKVPLFSLPRAQAGISFQVDANGGFTGLGYAFQDKVNRVEEWIENGLGRHLELVDETHDELFRGFVNKVNGTIGGLAVSRGPLMGVCNRLTVVYTPIETDGEEPVGGTKTTTPIGNDLESQAKYGIIERVYSGGKCAEAVALDMRDSTLMETREPESTENLSIGSSNVPAITLEVRGYRDWLSTFVYNVETAGTQTITAKLQAVMATDPNGIFSTDYSQVATNTTLVPAYDFSDRPAESIVKELVTYGDASFNRYVWGIYEDEKLYYQPAPTSIAYYHRVLDKNQRILTVSNAELKPWKVLPGKWLSMVDFLPGHGSTATLREDPRNIFIESMRYAQPWQLEINGAKVSTLAQKLARLSLGGMG